MALCGPPLPNSDCCTPDCISTDTIVFAQDFTTKGEFFLFGAGLRFFGATLFTVELPPFCKVLHAFLYMNVYKSNNINSPGTFECKFTPPNGPETVLKEADGDIKCFGICGSTCNPNDNPIGTFDINEQSTYLRNRVYRADVTELVKVNPNDINPITLLPTIQGQSPKNGSYAVETAIESGTTVQSGIRVPGCNAAQGCVLLVIVEWVKGKDAANVAALAGIGGIVPGLLLGGGPIRTLERERNIRIYHGAKLLTPQIANANSTKSGANPGVTLQQVYGGTTFFNLQDTSPSVGNAKIGFAAGDTEDALTKRMYINGLPLANKTSPNTKATGFNNFFGQNTTASDSTLLSTREIQGGFSMITDTVATAVVGGDCIAWFLFVISVDVTPDISSIPMQNHMVTTFGQNLNAGASNIFLTVSSNNNILGSGLLPFPGPPFFISAINVNNQQEIMQVISKNGQNQTNWVVIRAQAGTTAVAHKVDDPITLLATQSQMINWYGRRTNLQNGRRANRPKPGTNG